MPNYPYTNYESYIPKTQKRYMQSIYGPGGPKEYVSGQVRGVSASMQPYMEQMNKMYAGNIAGRGGLGGGAQDTALMNLLRDKIFALSKAGSVAQRDVSQTGVQTLGMAQQEAFKLTDDQIQKLMIDLKKKGLLTQFIGDILGAGLMGAGMAFGGPAGAAVGAGVGRTVGGYHSPNVFQSNWGY